MKYLSISFLISLASTLAISNLSGQERQPGQFRSIHQIEWEAYKSKPMPEALPKFQGTPAPLKARAAGPGREVFGYLPYWTYFNYPNLNYELLTTIAYFGGEINEFGNFVNLHQWPAPGLIDRAHREGVRVVLTTVLFNTTKLASLLSDPNRRTNLVNNLLTQVQSAGADGVNIDFEGVPGSQRSNLTAFMTELTQAFHTEIPGSFVTIFTPAVDWSNAFDYFALANATDGLVMQGYDHHWISGPTAGPVAPLTGNRWGFFNVTWTVTDYLGKTFRNADKLILGVPFYGYEWPTVDDALEANTTDRGQSIFYSEAYPNAMQYGRLWDEESQTPWYKYNDGSWRQGWYDDSLSLAKKFDLVNDEDLKGIAIWALSYDGQRQELQGALADAFGATAAPLRPLAFRVANVGEGKVELASQAVADADGYRVLRSTDGENFDAVTDFPGAVAVLSDLSPDSTYYFRMVAFNGNGESPTTEVLTARPSFNPVDILIVNGFDRTVGTANTFDFVRRFAPSVARLGHAFDSCSNEAVQNGDILLTDYRIVLWILGEEGTADESFSNSEQALVAEYLESGGKLFVSGSEIGFDLAERGSAADQLFYRTYLKAQYVQDQVASHEVDGSQDGIFGGLDGLTFDDGSHGTYNVDFPDGIRPLDGAVLNLAYTNFSPSAFGGAGLQYQGHFGESLAPGRLVYFAFPYETLYPAATRDTVMAEVLDFFEKVPTHVAGTAGDQQSPGSFKLAQNYPNPFNPATTISFVLTNPAPKRVQLAIFNIMGQRIRMLLDERSAAGDYEVTWDGYDDNGNPAASGVYIYRLQVGDRAHFKRMTLLR